VSSCNSENQTQLNMSEEKIIVTFLRCMPDFPYGQASFPRATLLFTAALLSIINFPLRAAHGVVPHAKCTIVSNTSN
jgi:hypothetical protein